MPSKNPSQRFEDILDNIASIEEFTAGLDLQTFTEDTQVLYAVKHALLVISEAAKKLGQVAEELCPEVPWPEVRGIGNYLRHEYDRIDSGRIWLVVRKDIPKLKGAATRALKSFDEGKL